MRQLTKTLFNELKEGPLNGLLEYVKNDDTLDMEFRRDYFTVYYRGGALLSVKEEELGQYGWSPLDNQYHEGVILKNTPEDFNSYIPEAKHLIDYYICTGGKNHLGEKEIQQLVVKENNYSPNSNDTDYFIVDMEYTDGEDVEMVDDSGDEKVKKFRFDLIALRWDSTSSERRGNKVSLAIIEVKQGIDSIKTSFSEHDGKKRISPGLKQHKQDFVAFLQKKKREKSLDDFYDDMKMIFLQKCALGLIKANIERLVKAENDITSESLQMKTGYMDFIFLLANYKSASRNLEIELIGMDECKFFMSSYMGYGLYANNIFTKSPKYLNMKDTYKENERKKQEAVFDSESKISTYGIFGTARCGGYMGGSNTKGKSVEKRKKYKFIIAQEYSKNNLYSAIREKAMQYFEKHNISWWRQEEDGYFPTGHLLSSQIHCLNHLFDLRTDKDAVKLIVEKATGMQFDEILPSLIDDKGMESYISFEFAMDNDKLLGENDEGWKRGTLCTSIDVMVLARKGQEKWLIPIEWKYTECYEREDKTNRTRLKRYSKLISDSGRLSQPEDGIPHSVYFIEPSYELMRQTLLCEQLVKNGYADDFFHINVIPAGNTELRNAVEKEFAPMLKDDSKFKIIDPQDLLSPLEEKNMHPELIEYLKKRYWYR